LFIGGAWRLVDVTADIEDKLPVFLGPREALYEPRFVY